MAEKEIWFRASDGRDIVCNEGSTAFSLMSNDGTFKRIDGPGGAETGDGRQETGEGEDLSKLSKKQLFELAVKRDVPVTAKMSKAEIVAAIKAAGEE